MILFASDSHDFLKSENWLTGLFKSGPQRINFWRLLKSGVSNRIGSVYKINGRAGRTTISGVIELCAQVDAAG